MTALPSVQCVNKKKKCFFSQSVLNDVKSYIMPINVTLL